MSDTVTMPRSEYEALVEQLEELKDLAAHRMAEARLASHASEVLPAATVRRLAAGEPPLRVWREHRGLTVQALADRAGIGASLLAQIETGADAGPLRVWRGLADALGIEIDDLIPWEA